MLKVAIYTRVSLDRAGDSTSPVRQETLCRQLAEAREWEVVKVFSDRDKSAWKRGVNRPGWNALLAAIERREVDVVMAYSLTRLGRRAKDLLELVDFLTSHDVALNLYDQNLDTSTPSGKVLFTVIAALAEMESEQTSTRVKSAQMLAAQRGEWHGGGYRSFGYERGAQIPKEAEVIRDGAARLLDGEALASLSREWNAAGLLTPAGNMWTSQTVGQMFRSPKIGGLRQHNGQLSQGNWEGILTSDEWARLCAELDGRKTNHGRAVHSHLLTGLAKCGRCGSGMKAAHFKQANGDIFDRYQCHPQSGRVKSQRTTCGACSASKKSLDTFVTNAFFDFLSQSGLRPVDGGQPIDEVQSELTETMERLKRLTHDHYVKGLVPEEMFLHLHQELSAKVDELRKGLDASTQEAERLSSALVPGNREDLQAWWDKASLNDRREALSKAIGRIVIQPAKHRGGNVFDTDRVEIQWSWDIYIRATEAEWEHMTEEERHQATMEAHQDAVELAALEMAREV